MSDLFQQAVAFHQQGQLETAEKYYRQALAQAQSPDQQAPIYVNLAILLQSLARWGEARQYYEQAIMLVPNEPQYYFNLGTLFQQQENWGMAATLFQRVTELLPDDAKAWNSLGVVLEQQQNWVAAEQAYRTALNVSPHHPKAGWNLGRFMKRQSRWDEALICFQTLVDCYPDWLEALLELAHTLTALAQWSEAVMVYRLCLEKTPSQPDIWNRLGIAHRHLGDLAAAETCFQQLLLLAPQQPWGYLNLGNLYQDQQRLSEAIACYKQALATMPENALAHTNMGCAYQSQGDYPKSQTAFEEALRLDPCLSSAHVNYGTLQLLLGQWEQGWANYEWRLQQTHFKRPGFSLPEWQGQALPDSTLLVWGEQGYGDSIQFMRYLGPLKERVGKVIVLASEPLARLFQTMSEVSQVVTDWSQAPTGALAQAALMSLPHRLGLAEPYPVPARFQVTSGEFPFHLENQLRPQIGIVWASSPRHRPDLKAAHHLRTCPLVYWLSLLEHPDMTWISLQTGDASQDLMQTSAQVLDASVLLQDFYDTAQVIKHLDLIITVDTAVAHLAGSLHKPVWVLLPHVPDWRWGLNLPHTSWYPKMRLFRQAAIGDWTGVMADVQHQLVKWPQSSYNTKEEEDEKPSSQPLERNGYSTRSI